MDKVYSDDALIPFPPGPFFPPPWEPSRRLWNPEVPINPPTFFPSWWSPFT